MNRRSIGAISVLVGGALVALAVIAVGLAAQTPDATNQALANPAQQATPTPQPQQPGEMGPATGMMGGFMMGGMTSMMGGPYAADARPLTIEEAQQRLEQQLAALDNPDLELYKIEAYSQNFYAPIRERGTDWHAFELIVDRYTGNVMPEMGPNMMWNTKYGMMAGMHGMMPGGMMGPRGPDDMMGPQGQMPGQQTQPPAEPAVTEDEARELAGRFLGHYLPGTSPGEVHRFYGYYTIMVEDQGGRTEGMLSVNAQNGAIWYHTWHGRFFEERSLTQGE